ncbi:ISWI chromatin-remodeling complex ATPase ISW2 [Schizosaccharomyces japonicus yFS275]|uniref:DNA helicase n=1 Tax=Schizosaccharomyces japonicus (strain yFS275 / FY16936) TaxID=402676 RepID=B6JZ54_SCHJY|nr:ISWI chromatin-remodeling complex ATPase ISW2 [Schizosaccharomyces japonicus yFS275]EEB06822.1 ISWI chromatin-remodeling complex ATPase ISW2 [Schizosaccharomyces japonicus yFS275]
MAIDRGTDFDPIVIPSSSPFYERKGVKGNYEVPNSPGHSSVIENSSPLNENLDVFIQRIPKKGHVLASKSLNTTDVTHKKRNSFNWDNCDKEESYEILDLTDGSTNNLIQDALKKQNVVSNRSKKLEDLESRFKHIPKTIIQETLESVQWNSNVAIHKLTFYKPKKTTPLKTSEADISVEDVSETHIQRPSRRKRRRRIATSDDDEEEEEEEEKSSMPAKVSRASSKQNNVSVPSSSEQSEASGVDETVEEESEFDKKVLHFLNACSIQELLDLSGLPREVIESFIVKRPFSTLEHARNAEKKKARGRPSKRSGPKIGRRVVNRTFEVMLSFEAVDSLIAKCDHYSSLISNTLRGWHTVMDEEKIDSFLENQERIDYNFREEQPELLAPNIILKRYQVIGVNWLNLMYQEKLSGILADEMGLGKTCQVIAFLALLKEQGIHGPHLIVVPASTVDNWLREFQKFSPSLHVEQYGGSQAERMEKRYYLVETQYDVLVTTYQLASSSKQDRSFLRHQKFNVCVFDEGHYLKNRLSERYKQLMSIPAIFRLLITGTPLQNNLNELMSLLAFILPNVFDNNMQGLDLIYKIKPAADASLERAVMSQERISRAKTMMNPFVLRRRKADVFSELPEKSRFVEKCEMVSTQKKVYQAILDSRNNPESSRDNILMQLRKAANHHLLLRFHYNDSLLRRMAKQIMREDVYADANEQYIFEDMQVMSDFELHQLCVRFPSIKRFALEGTPWMQTAKVLRLQKLLNEFKKDDRILVFSQFTQVLDILEFALKSMDVKYLRMDGSTPVETRQGLIDMFSTKPKYKLFLLSTKAGGFGINLTAANVVIMYDCSFNPFDDLQAEDRAHRVGQTRPVSIYRLVTENTIDENIQKLAFAKLALESSMVTNTEEIQKELCKEIFDTGDKNK